MRDFFLVTISILMILSLFGCSPEPVEHTRAAEEYLTFHTENDSLTKAGIREVEPGVYVKKFVLGNDVIYLRCDEDGNILSHSEANVMIPKGKTRQAISIL